MKKISFILMAAIGLLGFGTTACHDDDDVPNVSISAEYTGATSVDGVLYVVQSDTFGIQSLTATAVNPDHNAGFSAVTYGLDGWVAAITDVKPYAVTFEAGSLALGKHILSITMGILEEDCEPVQGYYATEFIVVADESGIPGSPDPETGTLRAVPSLQ